MQFETEAQKACYEKLAVWIPDCFPEAFEPRSPFPVFVVPQGSAAAMIEILPWEDQESLVSIWSYVVTGAEMTAELMRFLLYSNLTLRFGAFAIDDYGDIRLQATLIGSTCDRKELQTSVEGILKAADEYDDQIVTTWGGQRALDRRLTL